MNTELEDLKQELEEKEQELQDLEDGNKEDEYDEWLDEMQEPYKVGCCTFYPSQVLSELDPIAYRCGYSDFVESERDSYDEDIEDLKNQIEEIEEDE